MEWIDTKTPTRCWEFSPFTLDIANATLWRNDQVVPLRPKNFAALCYLIERRGQLVTKDELLNAVWRNRCVGEAVLKVCINDLRQALGDDAQAPAYLITIARRGYRFAAPVTEIHPENKKETSPARSPLSRHKIPLTNRSGYWVGRETAQATLLTVWRLSLENVRQVVFVTGEPGIGKTTLIEMFIDQVSQPDQIIGCAPMILRMRCVKHFGEGEALLPMIEAMEKRCRGPEGAEMIELLHKHAPVWLAQLPSVLKPEEREALQRQIFGASRERMVREGCELLEALSTGRPLILVLEDLHWSDDATLDFLSLLARRNEAAPLMIMASYRPTDASRRAHSVTLIHQELQMRGVSSDIAVTPFSQGEVKDYMVCRFPDMEIPDSVSQALFTRTGGLPLFVSNLIEYLVSQHQKRPLSMEMVVDQALPESIRRVIECEIERLSLDEQRLLASASAIGSQFSPILLGAVLDMDVAEVDSACDALVRRGQILLLDGMERGPQGEVVCNYAFRHALYVEVLYQGLSASQLIRLHLRIGECLERLQGKQELKNIAELALHFEKGWDWSRAVLYLPKAAANAAQRFANRQACDYLVRALNMVERLPHEKQAETRIELLKQSSAIRRSMGEIGSAKADLENMLATAKASHNGRAEVLALLELSRISVWLDRQQCLGLAEQAMERSKDLEDKILQTMVKGMWGGMNLAFGPWRADFASACHEAMDVARASKSPLVMHSRLTQHIYVELLVSRYKNAWALSEEALALSRTLGDGYMFIVGHYYAGLALLHLGEWGKLRQIAEESRRAFESNEASLPLRLHHEILMGWLHVEAGDHAGAKTYCEEALSASSGEWFTFISVHCSAILGRALLGLKDYAGAVRCFETFFHAKKDETLPVFSNYFFPACFGACEAWLALGEFERARHYAEQLQDYSARAPERTYLALSYHMYAEIALKEKRLDEAESQILVALSIIEQAELPLAAWRVYATAEKYYYLRGETRRAHLCQFKKQSVIRQLLQSLPGSDPLSEGLAALMGNNPVPCMRD
ncbi:AAA family ATPase [Nitrosospira sp. Is2]|uniref:AAA family ATPase n=1 Tax=Nitrosospira sp. Is2 TaxID=3080532 RepID=UPI002952C964|nr:AAA family ATPase [Nitrosospira sp. Is2]WON73434.1 AAA family ATPase [Nitrosospira sp. Is2]